MRHLTTVFLFASFQLAVLIAAKAQVQSTFAVAPSYTGISPVAIADFNQDGHPDIVNGMSVLLGNGDGTFKPGTPLSIKLQSPNYYIATADFNADGKLDIAFLQIASSPQPILILLGNGDGTF
jgi:FG-GAP-like repeat